MKRKAIDLETTSMTINQLLELLEGEEAVLIRIGDRAFQISEVEVQTLHSQPIRNGDRFTLYPQERKALKSTSRPRIAELHAGTAWVSDDFDDPLPDEFWLGEP